MNTHLVRALATWREWPVALSDVPSIVCELTTGRTNRNYVLQCGREQYRLRLNATNADALGINREYERAILDALKPLACTPPILYFNRQSGFALLPYLEGRGWTAADMRDGRQVERLLQLLARIQSQQVRVPVRDYYQYLENYLQQLKRAGQPLTAVELAALEEFRSQWRRALPLWEPVLSHHDLIPDNILETEKGLVILDWEYAALGHPQIDQRCIELVAAGRSASDESLRDGDLVDQLIFWLSVLWEQVNQLYRLSD
ncbi:phosphotransferase [Teredinibacter turnerae]|uniref:phosphotransferase n=1 Tax=Teredinibacter turnerae TaxID=2426 RepID=UPI00036D05E7